MFKEHVFPKSQPAFVYLPVLKSSIYLLEDLFIIFISPFSVLIILFSFFFDGKTCENVEIVFDQ